MKSPGLSAFIAFAALCLNATHARSEDWVIHEGGGGPGKGKHVVFMAGDGEYRSEEGLPMLAKLLSRHHGFKSTVLFPVAADGTINPDAGDSLPGSEALDSADAIVMLLRFRNYPDEIMQRFERAFLRGVPIVALRTSTHAFDFPSDSRWAKWTWNNQAGGFGKMVLGETWVSHWGDHKSEATRGVIEPSQKDHPVLRGVRDVFGDSDVYEAHPPADATILVRGQVLKGMNPDDPPADRRKKNSKGIQQHINDPMMPLVWTRTFKNEAGKTNKLVVTTMGAATDLQNEGLRRVVVNAVFWTLGLDVPPNADVTIVGDFKPTNYGFKSFKKGVRPGDHK